MGRALDAVRMGEKISTAALRFGVPRITLHNKVTGKSHLTLHLSDFCSANGIELIALYPNSTHILQPMDLAVFRPLKVAWRKEVIVDSVVNDSV